MKAHTVLVAFAVNADNFEQAQRQLMTRLPDPETDGHSVIDSWWIAEDNRIDSSDNDSAVFVPMGAQPSAERFLACARELLVSLKAAVSILSGWEATSRLDAGDTETVRLCKQALAKAEGRDE